MRVQMLKDKKTSVGMCHQGGIVDLPVGLAQALVQDGDALPLHEVGPGLFAVTPPPKVLLPAPSPNRSRRPPMQATSAEPTPSLEEDGNG